MEFTQLVRSLMLFGLAGLFEIGGGYLVWQWLREGKSIWYALVGAVVLVLYGVVPTLQPARFGRVYRPTTASSSCSPCCGAGRWTRSARIGSTCSEGCWR